jgi:hypothetical protein
MEWPCLGKQPNQRMAAQSHCAKGLPSSAPERVHDPGGCRTWRVDQRKPEVSPKCTPARTVFAGFAAHGRATGQKNGKKWTAAVDLQPAISKSDSLLDTNDLETELTWKRQLDAPVGGACRWRLPVP